MLNATVTVRELKNKNSGVDLSIPTYNETAGLLGSTVEYMVVIVSNLDVFKLPKHKETDTIQFTVAKKFSDFEDLYKKINDKFSGTAFPPLPRKVLLKSDAVYRERRNGLEHFLKFIAVVPKLVTSNIFLEFLGVKPTRVNQTNSEGRTHEEGETEEQNEEEGEKEGKKKQNLDVFDEGETEKELFLQEGEDGGDDNMADIFGDADVKTESAAMFDVPDLGGGLREGEDDDLVLPSAKVDNPVIKTEDMTEEERETSELLNIDDNLEELLKLTTRQKDQPSTRKLKPSIPAKPKPGIPSKPASKKPDIPSKPSVPPKPKDKGNNSDSTTSKTPDPAELSNDDIMKYISENSSVDADLDLF